MRVPPNHPTLDRFSIDTLVIRHFEKPPDVRVETMRFTSNYVWVFNQFCETWQRKTSCFLGNASLNSLNRDGHS